jgi:hypothetical protein
MRKIIRLNESDLIKIVKSVKQMLKEGNGVTYNEIKGTTSSEPVKNVKVITDTGINATNQDFKGSWGVKDDTGNGLSIVTTFRNKSLSTFTLNNARPPYENYLEITVSRYKKTPAKGGNGNYYQLDQSSSPVVTSIVSKEKNPVTKVFATRYQDPDDAQNYEWRISGIVGAGNGLLALSRAIKEGKGFPDKITISFNSAERTSGGYKYDSTILGNITTSLNAITQIAAASLFNKTNVGDLGLTNKDSNQTQFLGKSDDVLSKTILSFLYSNDKKFIPAEDIERVKNTLTPYNAEPFKAILDKLTSDKDVRILSYKLQYSDKTVENTLKNKLNSLYGGLNEELRNEYVRQYKLRIKSFLTTKYGAEQAENMAEQINFTGIQQTIQYWYLAALKGASYSKGQVTPKASQKTTTNKYDLGSSAPKQ